MRNYFHFKRFDRDRFLLTNDLGRHLFLNAEEFRQFLGREAELPSKLAQKLREQYFLLEPSQLISPEASELIRDMKSYLFTSTALHIFVVTNACNLQCVYCQAQSDKRHPRGFMTPETGRKAIDVALQSPAEALTFEFQGGEPLMNFPTIRSMVEYSESVRGDRRIQYTIVSNLSLLTDEILDFLERYQVSVSTSLDGPPELHDRNRKSALGGSSYQAAIRGIERLRLRGRLPGAIQTTTRASLPYAREIVREYEKLGMYGIFLRPLTPLGFAQSDWAAVGYTSEDFLAFYRTAFDEILRINLEGRKFPELHATYFLKKILRGSAVNYMELRSPCGAGIGQLAYYYDGSVYSCDEARMVAEAGDPAFRLGSVETDDYQSLLSGKRCRAICGASILEGLPGCCDCVYQPYCGVCPVINYAQNGDPFPKQARNYRCKLYAGILDYLFSLIRKQEEPVMNILNSWVEEE